MGIAANYRKHPEAMALQMPLPFGRVLIWALPRPTSRIGRKIRAARAATFKTVGRIMYPVKLATPQWFKDARRRAQDIAKMVRAECMHLDFLQER